jgi:hypothetical protein
MFRKQISLRISTYYVIVTQYKVHSLLHLLICAAPSPNIQHTILNTDTADRSLKLHNTTVLMYGLLNIRRTY